MPLYITTFQFCLLNESCDVCFTSPSPPSAEPSPSFAWLLSPWTVACSPEPSWFPSALRVRPSLPGMWLCLLSLPSFPSTLPHHFALAAGLFSALFSSGPAALGQLFTSGMLHLLLLFHFPPFPSQPPWLSRQGQSCYFPSWHVLMFEMIYLCMFV